MLRALVAERYTRILAQIDGEEAKPEPDQDRIAALDEERFALPFWGSYPDEQGIDAVIEEWKAIIQEQRRSIR